MTILFQIPKGSKIYIDGQVFIFDHIDGMYSYCYLEEDKQSVVHLLAYANLEAYKDGYKLHD